MDNIECPLCGRKLNSFNEFFAAMNTGKCNNECEFKPDSPISITVEGKKE